MSAVLDDLTQFDDVEFEVNDEAYADQEVLGNKLPPQGNYRLRIDKIGIAKDQDGNPRFTVDQNGRKFPTLLLEEVSAVEGPAGVEPGDVVLRYVNIYSKPFERKGKIASGLGDLSRSLDTTVSYASIKDGIKQVIRLAEQGVTFRARIAWEAYDKDYYEALVAEAMENGEDVDSKKEKELRKKATIKGMKKFPKNDDGTYKPEMVHPVSGNEITARAVLGSIYPSSAEKVKIG